MAAEAVRVAREGIADATDAVREARLAVGEEAAVMRRRIEELSRR